MTGTYLYIENMLLGGREIPLPSWFLYFLRSNEMTSTFLSSGPVGIWAQVIPCQGTYCVQAGYKAVP